MEAQQKIIALEREVAQWKTVSIQLLNKMNEVIQKLNNREANTVITELKIESIHSNLIQNENNQNQLTNHTTSTQHKPTDSTERNLSASQADNLQGTPDSSKPAKRKIVHDNDEIPKATLTQLPDDQILILDQPVQATRKRLKKISEDASEKRDRTSLDTTNITNNNNNNNNNNTEKKATLLIPVTKQKQQSKAKEPVKQTQMEAGYNTRLKRGTLPPAPKGKQRKRAQDYPSDSEDSSYYTESGEASSSASSSEESVEESEEETVPVAPKKTSRTSRSSQSTPTKKEIPSKKFSATSSKYYQSSEEEGSESDNNFIVDDEEEESELQVPEVRVAPVKRKKLGPIDEEEIDDLLATQGVQEAPQIIDDDSESEKDENFIVDDNEVEYVETTNTPKPQQEASPKKISSKMDIEAIKKEIANELEAKETPIHNAIARGDLDQVGYLIKKHGWQILRTKDSVGSTPLMCAVESGNMKCLNMVLYCLINNDTNFEKILENTYPDIEELFATFVDAKKMENLREEIIHTCDRYGLNVFFHCCRLGRYQMFRHLLGIVTIPAAFESPSEVKNSIIAELRELQDSTGAYLLHHAASAHGSDNLVTEIIETRINDINCKDSEQSTPLHWAVGAQSVDALKVLILYGANVELTDVAGSTALHTAAANGFTDCVNVLVHEGKAQVNCRDRAGWPPLLHAGFQAHKETVLVLLEADPSTLSVLGDRFLLADPKAKPVVMSVLKYIATVPQFYGILNQFLRNNIHLLEGSFSFLLEKKGLLDLENKRLWLISMIEHKLKRAKICQLEVDRNNLLDDTLIQILFRSFEPAASSFKVTFRGEAGYGAGVRREFFQVISAAILKSERPKLFTNMNNQGYQPIFTQDRSKYSDYYRLIGVIIGMAILHKELTSFHFTKPFLKQLLGQEIGVADVQDVDQEYYNSLKWMLENDITDMDLNFSVDIKDEETNKLQTVNLIPNGKNIPVTEKNKTNYVNLLSKWKLETSFQQKKDAVLEGIGKVFQEKGVKYLTSFNENELQLLISGLHKVDVTDWEQNSVYQGYMQTDPQIIWFWSVVKKMNEEERALLLQFATGSSNVPVGGFSELQGMSGKQRFTISAVPNDPPGRLISASTCFNLLKLPRYQNEDEMQEKIHVAIRFGVEGFAFS